MINMRSLDIRRSLSDTAGFILPTAIIVLLIVTVLIGAAITVAAQTSTSTTRDDNSKAALEAAEAGLQVASYRISQFKPETTKCITGTAEASPTSGIYCEGPEESLGNSAVYRYWTSKGLESTNECVGKKITVKSGFVQRCIIAEGVVNGVKPGVRLQTRIESAVGESLFSIKGILGLEEVSVSGSVKATSIVASNKKIVGKGSAAFEKGFEVCPGGEFKPKAGAERNKSGVTVGGIGGTQANPPLEKERSAAACPIKAEISVTHATAASNEDSRIGNQDEFFTEGKSVNKFTASNYELQVESNGVLTLGGSKYYFCNFVVARNGTIKIAKGAKVEIFIDDHADNPQCPEGSGAFSIGGNAHLENPNGASALLIQVAGKGPLTIENSGTLKADVYAPEAEVKMSGSGTLTGAIVGKTVHLEAGSFNFSEEEEELIAQGAGGGAYTRQGWEQCTPRSGASEAC